MGQRRADADTGGIGLLLLDELAGEPAGRGCGDEDEVVGFVRDPEFGGDLVGMYVLDGERGNRTLGAAKVADKRLQTQREGEDRKAVDVDQAAVGRQPAQEQVAEYREAARLAEHVARSDEDVLLAARKLAEHVAVRGAQDGLCVVEYFGDGVAAKLFQEAVADFPIGRGIL